LALWDGWRARNPEFEYLVPNQVARSGSGRGRLRPASREGADNDDDAETLVEAIAKHAHTESIGDGKIWVSTVDSALRVRTGERDRDAV
jgi:Nitrogen regulatory protein P-II